MTTNLNGLLEAKSGRLNNCQ